MLPFPPALPPSLIGVLRLLSTLDMQAAAYGKVFVSLLMPALRCMSKATFPADLTDPSAANLAELRISATVHIVMAALILIGCLVVTMFIIPRQIAKVQAIETLDVPPGAAGSFTVLS